MMMGNLLSRIAPQVCFFGPGPMSAYIPISSDNHCVRLTRNNMESVFEQMEAMTRFSLSVAVHHTVQICLE